MTFIQDPPRLGNQYRDDALLRSYLERTLPGEVLDEIEPELDAMGALAGGELYEMQLADRRAEPLLTQWDAWGNRVDAIEHTPLWRRAEELAARHGLVAIPYERKHGTDSRVHQMALVYLFTPSTDIYSCPLAMSDGAARTLVASGNRKLTDRALPRLTSREPEHFWTSGQWMTETIGGSDVGASETVARKGEDGVWRLYGRKWFTSAASAPMALTLARPEGSGPGGRGLALFYLETRDEEGRLQGISIDRLKDKLGTRKLPTAELTLDGTPAEPVWGLSDGVRHITPMLNITRLWNGVSSVAAMRRGVALAEDYAARREAFGARLAEQPLHQDTLAGLRAELAGAFLLTFEVVERVGWAEGEEPAGGEDELLRVLTPIMKLVTAKQAVAVASEVLEAFGGAGYVEDTGLPALLRDAQVLPIWEGTTNVLALETLRALEACGGLEPLERLADAWLEPGERVGLAGLARLARSALGQASSRYGEARAAGREALETEARRLAMTVGRALELALLVRHAAWCHERGADPAIRDAAHRFAAAGVSRLHARRSAAEAPPAPVAVAESN